MNKFKTILVGIDFSIHSRNALRQAWRIAEDQKARLHVAHIVPADEIEDNWDHYNLTVDEALDKIRGKLDTFIELALQEKTPTQNHVLYGHPVYDLLDLQKRTKADLLVLGSRGTNAEHHHTGMVATKCARRSPVSVLLVREEQAESFRSIVACIDFSEASQNAMEYASELASEEGAELQVLHVHYPPWMKPTHVQYDLQTFEDKAYRDEYHSLLTSNFETFVSPVHDHFPNIGFKKEIIEHPTVSYAIVQYLRDTKADLAVIASQGHSKIHDMFLGSTVERIIQESPCSVLTVRPAAE
jgi:nucleotide-binding universal stress UspA family protein